MCRRHGHRQRQPAPVGEHVQLGAGLAPVDRIRAGQRAPYLWRDPRSIRVRVCGLLRRLEAVSVRGITWNQLPTSLVGCSGVTCWRRLRDWTEAGVWPALHAQLLDQLRALGELDLDRCAVDGSHVRALKGGTTSARRRSIAAVPAPSTI